MLNYSIGEVYDLVVEFQEGDGRRKTRPVVIIDIDEGEPVVLLVAPLTGAAPKETEPIGYYEQFKIPVDDWQEVPLKKETWVKSHPGNLVRVEPSCLGTRRGQLTERDLKKVLQAIFQ